MTGNLRPLILLLPVLAFCHASCATDVRDRLTRLEESQSRDNQVMDMRISHVEDRLIQVEGDIGSMRGMIETAAPSGRRRSAAAARTAPARQSSERLPAAPVPTGAGVIDPRPAVPDIPYQPKYERLNGAALPQSNAAPGPQSVPVLAVAPFADTGPGLEPVILAPPQSKSAKPRKNLSSASGHATGSAAYDAAMALYNKGDYVKAERGFAAFAGASPRSSLAANALYWQGECSYSLGKYDAAILAFKDVAAKYPKHPKAAAALLKAGYAYERLGDMENARFYWQILLDDFPSSSPAGLARQKMG